MTSGLLDTLNNISTSLAILAQQIRAEAQSGLGSRNKVAEHIFLPVLRRLYGAPTLANANTLSANFPGIDLYDPSSGLGVQVTSETSAAKITETIETLVGGTLPIKRLVIALAVGTAPSYRTSTRENWRTASQDHFDFEPDVDVLAFDHLLNRIQNLPPSDITDIAAELQSLVRGTHAIYLLPHLKQHVESQLAEEKRIARYIPDVFVETQDTKYHARCFAHPVLFGRRIASWFDRQPLAGLNRLATMSGLPPVNMQLTDTLAAVITPEDATAAAQILMHELLSLDETLATYRDLNRERIVTVPRDATRTHVFDKTVPYIKMIAGGQLYRLGNRRTELQSLCARVFLLTGPAGQGKTNFLCDFTERFLLRHEIPCAYVTARQLSRIPDPNLPEVVRQLIFPSSVTNLHEGLVMLADICAEKRQPFVLVIDGLNEHTDVRTFAGQLEHLLETVIAYPYVRVLMTCRSEFLEQRFGALLSGPLAPAIFISKAHGQRFDDKQYEQLVSRYFQFFEVQRSRVHPRVIKFLQRDVLLLRFFCEAYGARDRTGTYTQPYVRGIYREEIFRRYVEDKLGRAQQTVMRDRSAPRPLARHAELKRVLSLVTAHMLETGQYADVPRTVVPDELNTELTALLDEELVLRQDLAPTSLLLAEPNEVLNFTFDELRDYLLAQRLMVFHAQEPREFDRLVALQQPSTTQSIEGLQRSLFDVSRVPENGAFLKGFSEHPWYSAVYDTEVFAVPPTYLNEDDLRIAQEALVNGGIRAQHFVREMTFRWDSSAYPVLNLDALLAFAHNAEISFFTDVIVPTFKQKYYGQESMVVSLCHFVENDVLPTFVPYAGHLYDPVFRLLLLLLPIDANPTLDSPTGVTFSALIELHPAYGVGLIQEALDESSRLHRSFLWRSPLCL